MIFDLLFGAPSDNTELPSTDHASDLVDRLQNILLQQPTPEADQRQNESGLRPPSQLCGLAGRWQVLLSRLIPN
jgi:hypothetical protein